MRFKKRAIPVILIIIASLFLITLLNKFFSAKQKKINVILIVIDVLRVDHLGCYGYKRNTSPNIDKFAKEGVLFMKAFSHGPATRMSVASILTSLYPGSHRIFYIKQELPDKFVTLPEILRESGYATAAFVGPQLTTISNVGKRFATYKILLNKPTPLITHKAISWIKQNKFRPFFLYLHYLNVHPPYLPPGPYNKLFWKEDIKEWQINFMAQFVITPHGRSTVIPQGELLDFVVSQYDGAISYIDVYMKRLLEEINRLNLSDDTLVIITSDHGEEFNDHGKFFHGHSVYDELLHVPLIIRLPGRFSENRTIQNVVGLVDIAPTILDILKIRPHQKMQGVSDLPPKKWTQRRVGGSINTGS